MIEYNYHTLGKLDTSIVPKCVHGFSTAIACGYCAAIDRRSLPIGETQPEELNAAYSRIDELTDALTAARIQLITLGGNEPDGCQIQQAVLSVIDEALS
jgi:hypothetical protein